MLFSVLGVFFIGSVAADLLHLFYAVHDYVSESEYGWRKQLLAQNWRWGAGAALQLAIGVVLLLRARRWALYFNPTAVAAAVAQASSSSLRCPKCDHPYLPESYREDAEVHSCANCGTDLRAPRRPKDA